MNIHAKDLNLLPILDAILSSGSVSLAAKHLGLTQPAVSNALNRLRDEFSDPLFVREGQKLIPTDRALHLQTELKAVLQSIERNIFSSKQFDPMLEATQFRISVDDYFSQTLAPRLSAHLHRKFKHCRMEFLATRDANPFQNLAKGDFDFAIRLSLQGPQGTYRFKILDEDFVCLVSKKHPRIQKKLTLKQFVEEKHILISPYGGFDGLVDQELEKIGLQREVVTVFPYFSCAPIAIASSEHIVTVPRRISQIFADRFSLATFPTPVDVPPFAMFLYWHERTHRQKSHEWFREQIRSTLLALEN